MKPFIGFGVLVLAAGLSTACDDATASGGAGGATSTSGSTTKSSNGASMTTGGTTTSGTTSGTTTTGGMTSSSSGGSMCSGATPIALKVKNYIGWCDVTVNGGTPSGAAEQTVCVAAGTYDLVAVAHTNFELGTTPWHDVDGDTGAGVQGNLMGSGQSQSSTAKITVSGTSPDCAWACCQTAGASDCPTTDQCP